MDNNISKLFEEIKELDFAFKQIIDIMSLAYSIKDDIPKDVLSGRVLFKIRDIIQQNSYKPENINNMLIDILKQKDENNG